MTHEAIPQLNNVVVHDPLQNRNLALQILEELGGELAADDRLDCDWSVRVLHGTSRRREESARRSSMKTGIPGISWLASACRRMP